MAKKTKRSASQNSPALGVIVLGAVILIVAIILLLIQQPDTVIAPSNGSVTQSSDIPYPEVARVSLADAKSAYDQGNAVFLDVRSSESFREEHIVGALSIPEVELPARLDELDPKDWIITYCT